MSPALPLPPLLPNLEEGCCRAAFSPSPAATSPPPRPPRSAGSGGERRHPPTLSLCATTSPRRPLLGAALPSPREEAERRERESLLTLDGWIRTCRAPRVVRLGFTKPAPIIYHRCRFLKKPPPITLTTKMSVFRWPRANYSNGMDTKRCRIFNKNRHLFLTQVIGAGF